MKTLLFCNLIPGKWGAYEAFVAALAREFRAAGDELVPVFAAEPVPAVAAQLRASGARWQVITAWASGSGRVHPWGFCRPALALVRTERPDVAVVNYGNELPSLAVAWAAALGGAARTRWVWVQHQQIQDPSPAARALSRLRLLALAFVHFVALYAGGAASLRRRGVPPGRITVLPNAIADYVSTRPAGWLAAELGLPPDTALVATAGSLIPRKRVDWALRAFARASSPPAVLLVIGDGPERARLESLARDLGVAERVRFLGPRADVREILPRCALLLHTAAAEASAYAITESMAAAIPCVATAAGAAREQVVEGETGHVVGRDDFDGLVSQLSRLLANDEQRQRFGRAARQRFLAQFRLEDSARQYHALYRQLAGSSAPPA